MEKPRIDFPEVSGKTIAELCVYDDPTYGREVIVQFTDGTQLSIAIVVKQTVDAQFCQDGIPQSPMFIRNG